MIFELIRDLVYEIERMWGLSGKDKGDEGKGVQRKEERRKSRRMKGEAEEKGDRGKKGKDEGGGTIEGKKVVKGSGAVEGSGVRKGGGIGNRNDMESQEPGENGRENPENRVEGENVGNRKVGENGEVGENGGGRENRGENINIDVLEHIIKMQVKNLELSSYAARGDIIINESLVKIFGEKVVQAIEKSASALLYDWDDYLFAGHTGHSAVFVSKAFSQDQSKFIRSVLIGNEVGARLGILTLIGPLNGQMMTHIHGIISATITEFLTGDIGKIPSRLSFFASNPNFLTFGGFMGGDTKISSVISPMICGIASCLFELKQNIYAEREFLNLFSWREFDKKFVESLFSPEFFLTKTMMIKKLPGCAYVLPQVECIGKIKERIRKDEGIQDIDIESIDVVEVEYSAVPAVLDRIALSYPDSQIPAQFSTPIAVSIALLSDLAPYSYRLFASDIGFRNKVMSLCGKIRLTHRADFTSVLLGEIAEHFPFILERILTLGTLARALAHVSQIHWNLPRNLPNISMSSALDLMRPIFGSIKFFSSISSILSSGHRSEIFKENFENFRFLFPTRVKVRYNGRIYEEELKTHDFHCQDPRLEDFLAKKEELVRVS